MTLPLIWLPEVLESAGLKVAVRPGWDSLGGAMDRVMGVMCHHTAGPRSGNMPSLDTLALGRPDLPGPLAQLGLGRDGTYYVIAAGRCNHAGAGVWRGISSGNRSFIGIEAENAGRSDDRWPDIQMEAYRYGVAAILTHVGRSADFCVGHKEYALPRGRKIDPLFDMDLFRANVKAIMSGTFAPLTQIPAIEAVAAAGEVAPRLTLRRGSGGELVKRIQLSCAVPPSGDFDGITEAALREFQRRCGVIPDGLVGPNMWKTFDNHP
ncbi:peptidoglycan recognition protein family protein [Massilia sp. DWR3-1-1]|uniref:peptidoglycan recognition protein family protein n=1 Tax=Massilia sp. DWR3-1-1 TaxID=2804559 RepID=UPI003CF042E8